jgi:hypothetical protein
VTGLRDGSYLEPQGCDTVSNRHADATWYGIG